MSFGGAVGSMITSLKNNKQDRKSALEKTTGYNRNGSQLHFDKKASKQQLSEIKNKLIK